MRSAVPADGAGVLVLLPTYNERDNLASVVDGIRAHLPSAHLLIIDDASPDGTGDLAERLRAERPGFVEVVHRPGKQGLGTAYLRGFRHALARPYGHVVTMDADLSHAPAHLPAILEAAAEADLVIGSRYVAGGRTVNWGLERRVLSVGANLFTRRALGLAVRDCTSGYRCYARRLLESIDLDQIVADGYSFQIELLWRARRAGARVHELPITFVERAHGDSKISRDEVLKAVSTVCGLRRMAAEEERARPVAVPPPPRARGLGGPPAPRVPGNVDLSILIVNYDTADFLEACLASIAQYPPRCAFEVMVVDNHSSDGSAAMVRRRFPDVRLHALDENVGFARASNLALGEAGGRYLLLLNSDTRVLAESLQGLVRVLEENPRAGVVGCKQLDGRDQLQLTWGRFPSFFNEIVRKALHWRLRIDGAQVREYLDRKYFGSSQVDWVAGSCLLARREAVEDAGLLDENIFLYFEDIDWCRRIQQQGWEIRYEPGVRIIHHGGQSAQRHLIDALVAYRRSQLYFCRKYFGTPALLALKALVAAKSLLAFARHSVAWLAAGDREERFRAYCMLLTIKKIAQALLEPVPGQPASPLRLPTPPARLEILEPAPAQARDAR